jgi:hypothetical protein
MPFRGEPMKMLLLTVVVAATLLTGFAVSAAPETVSDNSPLGWPAWMKVGIVLQLPQHELTSGVAAANAILIQNYNPGGLTGTGVVGHLSVDGIFTGFERSAEIEQIALGRLTALKFQISGLSVSIAENLETLTSTHQDRKATQAIGLANLKRPSSEYWLTPASDLQLRTSRVDSGPLGQVIVAGRFFKLETPFLIDGKSFNVLQFSDFETYDRGGVTFGNLSASGQFIESGFQKEPWQRRGNRTYIGGNKIPTLQIWDGESEIFQQLIGGRNDQKVVQSSKLSVLKIDRRVERYTRSDIMEFVSPPNFVDVLAAGQYRAIQSHVRAHISPVFGPSSWNSPTIMTGSNSTGKTHMIKIWMCENLFDPY